MAKIIVVAGIKGSGSFFMVHAINQFLEQAGYSTSILSSEDIKNENWEQSDKDFLLVKSNEYDMKLDAISNLVFTAKRNLIDGVDIESIQQLAHRLNEANHLISWMRSRNHAYNQNYDLKMNSIQLNNWANLNSIFAPIQFIFKDMKFDINADKLMNTLDKIDPRYERKMQNLPNSK